MQAEGLQQRYRDPDNRSIWEAAHSMCALAFVPDECVPEIFDMWYDEISNEFVPLAMYFETSYVRGVRTRGWRRAVKVAVGFGHYVVFSFRVTDYIINSWTSFSSTLEKSTCYWVIDLKSNDLNGSIVDSALEITLWGMSSSPKVCDMKYLFINSTFLCPTDLKFTLI